MKKILIPLSRYIIKRREMITDSLEWEPFSKTVEILLPELNYIQRYTDFVLQKLELGQFIIQGKDGKVLKGKPLSPNTDAEWIRWENEQEEYYKKEALLLFKGFKVSYISTSPACYVIYNDEGVQIRFHKNGKVTCSMFEVETIEDILSRTKSEMEVTDNVAEMLYL